MSITLPTVQHPTFDITIPSTKKKIKFRPFAVGEEKILLFGQQSRDPKDMYEAIKQVINGCAVKPIDLDSLAPFDFDYIFVKLRAQSVSNVVELKYVDPEDDERYDVLLNLDDVEVQFPEAAADPLITINDKLKVKLQYPTMAMMDEILNDLEGEEKVTASMIVDQLVMKAMELIIEGNEIYPVAEASKQELAKFIASIPPKAYAKIREFFESTPQLKHTVTYTTKGGTERSIELNGLTDFFMF
jgi:hypothetical protein